MKINESFAPIEMSAPPLCPGTRTEWRRILIAAMLLATAPAVGLAQWAGSDDAFLPGPVRTVSTVPANGDVNPYGVAFVPNNFYTGSGPLKHGDILVSNFNNSANLQGTGTTIVRIPAGGWGLLQRWEHCNMGSSWLATALRPMVVRPARNQGRCW